MGINIFHQHVLVEGNVTSQKRPLMGREAASRLGSRLTDKRSVPKNVPKITLFIAYRTTNLLGSNIHPC